MATSERPICSHPRCSDPATAIHVSTGNVTVDAVRYPRCDEHPLSTAVRWESLATPQQEPTVNDEQIDSSVRQEPEGDDDGEA